MTKLTRQALYDLVWAEPVRAVAASLGISDVGLKKRCSAADIPVPDRGYWTKLKAGKPVIRVQLPPRSPGKSDTIQVGPEPTRWPYDPEAELKEPLPQPANVEGSIELLRERVVRQVGRVTRSRDLIAPVAPIRKLLEADVRREAKFKASPYDWNMPYFQSPFEQRRLRILDALAKALGRCGGKLEISGAEARSLRFKVGDQGVTFTLDHPKAKEDRWGRTAVQPGPVGPLRLVLKPRWGTEGLTEAWSDETETKLEDQLTDIVVTVLLIGETEYRGSCAAQYQWALERRARNEAEIIKRRLEAEQQERERLAREAKARKDLLFSQAQAWRTATDIRGFVNAVLVDTNSADAASIRQWSDWALEEADLIDPVKQGALVHPAESK